MVKTKKGKMDAKKQEVEKKEATLRGKALASVPTGSGTERTSRKQVMATKKSKEQEKRTGKSVAVPTNEGSRTMEIEHCMHELILFLDILCAMSRLLVLRVYHLKKSYILNLLTHLNKKSSLTQIIWTN
ncbi:hypothetical protein Bca4012_020458 [Brassica carinata]